MKSGSKRKADQIGTHLDVVTDATYWNGLAEKYEDEVCSSRDDGVNSSLVEALQSNADPKALAVDFGCGPGLYLPTLARLFGQVVGVDLSCELVEKARVRTSDCSNVSVAVRNLVSPLAKGALQALARSGEERTKKKKKKKRKNKRSRREAKETTRTITPAPRCRFALCANVLLAPSREMRSKILLNIHNALDASGTLLLVVPSTESVLFTELMLRRWDAEAAKDEGLLSSKFKVEGGKKIKCKKKGTGAKARPRRLRLNDVLGGVLPAGGVATQHFLRAQLVSELGAAGFSVKRVEKVEYDLTTEFAAPLPKWMKHESVARPWDWMCLATPTE